MAGLHTNRGAKRAREARAAFGLDPDAPVGCLLGAVEAADCAVVVWEMPGDVAGACYRDGDRAVLHVNARQRLTRQRFTLAHELGHVRCGHEGRLAPDDAGTIDGRTSDWREVEANAFAAEFLVPCSGLQARLSRRPGLDEIATIAAAYGISAWVVVFRLVTCRLVDDQHGARLRAEVEEGLHEEATLGMRLPRFDDGLSRIASLPYLSPALRGSALAGAISGRVSVDAVARATACAPLRVREALEQL